MHVALLHGLGADRRAFQRFERLLPSEWVVRSFDLLGHGEADKPEFGYSLPYHAQYIAAEIQQWSGDVHPIVVGHSYGSNVAATLAALHHELPAGLVMLDPIIHGHDEVTLTSRTDEMMQGRREGRVGEVVHRLFHRESPALRQWTIDTWESMSVGVIDEIDHDWMRFASMVACPVAIAHGDLELGGGGDLAATWFSNPRVERIAGAGHYLHATHARETADAVERSVTWIAEQPR